MCSGVLSLGGYPKMLLLWHREKMGERVMIKTARSEQCPKVSNLCIFVSTYPILGDRHDV